MKLALIIGAVFGLMVTAILPVQAQNQTVTLEFRVRVMGVACAETTYWVVMGSPDEQFYHQLSDADGDNVYVLRTSDGIGAKRAIRLVQGSGTQQRVFGPEPNEPISLIKDFGIVTIPGDMVFEATAAGCPAALPNTGHGDRSVALLLVAGVLFLASGVYLQYGRRSACHSVRI